MPSRPRSEASRQGLVEATSRLLRERGVQGLRIRDVAAYAGMSPGAVLYHFDNTDELLYAVHQQSVDGYITARRAASGDDKDDARDRVMRSLEVGLPGRDGPLIELLYEVHGMARRSLRHAELVSLLPSLQAQATRAEAVAETYFQVAGRDLTRL